MATAAVTVWDRRPQRTSQPATVAATRCASGVYAPRMAFRGWPDEAVEFFEGLQADNTKTYWTAHKPVYEASVYAPMAGLLAELTADKVEVGGSSSLKRAPKGYPADHPRIELLRHKGLIAWRHWPVAAWLGTAAAKRRVVEFLRAAAPLHAWLDEQVGPSTVAPHARR